MSRYVISTEAGCLANPKAITIRLEDKKGLVSYLAQIYPDNICEEHKTAQYWADLFSKAETYLNALKVIAHYDSATEEKGICPYGCDAPYIAQQALMDNPRRPAELVWHCPQCGSLPPEQVTYTEHCAKCGAPVI